MFPATFTSIYVTNTASTIRLQLSPRIATARASTATIPRNSEGKARSMILPHKG